MTEISYPFFGGIMTEDWWAKMHRYYLGTGVMAVTFNDALNELAITAGTGMTVVRDTGAAHVQGMYYQDDATKVLTIAANPSLAVRADLIVLECKWGPTPGIVAKVITGTSSSPTALVQSYGVKWQIALAQINVPQNASSITTAMIVDKRNFVGSGSAQGVTISVAMPDANATMRANADFQIPVGATYYDAQVIINLAFAALPASGGTVQLSEGNCTIQGSVVPTANSTLAGHGEATVLTMYSAASAVPMINCSAANVVVRDLSLVGGGSAFTLPTRPAYTAGMDGILVSASNVKIRRVKVTYARGFGIRMTQASPTTRNEVKDCQIQQAYQDGIACCSNFGRIVNNYIEGCGYNGIQVVGASGQTSSNNKIMGNIINGVGSYGIWFDGTYTVSYNVLTDNEISNVGLTNIAAMAGIILTTSGCNYNSILANHISGNALGAGISVKAGVLNTRVLANQVYDSSVDTAKNVEDLGTGTVKNYNLVH